MAGVITQPVTVKDLTLNSNEFGPAPKDGNKQPIQNSNYFQTNDITPTNNLQSPLALTTTVVPLLVPKNAVRVTILADGIVRISDVADASQYFNLPASVPITLDVMRQGTVYVRAATTANISFAFSTL